MAKTNSVNKRANHIRVVVFTALMTALTVVLTVYTKLPMASGYYNFGDVPIFMAACLLGPFPALITGALGAMLGDVILGYMAYAPFTLIIKGLEGFIAAVLFQLISKFIKKQIPQALIVFADCFLCGLIMAFGYFIAEGVLLAEDKWTGGIANLPLNILQGTISAAVATVLLYACQIKKLFGKIYNRVPQANSTVDKTDDDNQDSKNNSNCERKEEL